MSIHALHASRRSRRVWLGIVATIVVATASIGAAADAQEIRARLERLREAERALADGRLDDAASVYLECLRSIGDGDRAALLRARATDGLADARRLQGRFEEAEPLYVVAIGLWERLLGPTQPRLATSLHNLGAVRLAAGRSREAVGSFEQALAIWNATLGADSEAAVTTRRAIEAARAATAAQEPSHPMTRM
jgi:tetratricopeptide (TPR) repeat protein